MVMGRPNSSKNPSLTAYACTREGVPSVGEKREVARLESRRALDGQFRIVQPVDLAAGEKSRGDPPVREGGAQAVEILRVGIRKRLEEDGAQRW